MKLNTSLFICLFFSAIIAIKAKNSINQDYEYSFETEENADPTVKVYQDVQVKDNNQQKLQAYEFKPSKKLEEVEKNMPISAQAFIKDGKVEKTLKDTYASVIDTDVAKEGLKNVDHEWQLMLSGSEASRVVDTFGTDFKKIVTSPDARDMIRTMVTTVYVLLINVDKEKLDPGLGNIMSITYLLFTSPNMPEIINKACGLVITFVNKPDASLFAKKFWDELKKLLEINNLNKNLINYFNNTIFFMNSMNVDKKGKRQLSRKSTFTQ